MGNIMVIDGLATQGTKTSAAMVLTFFILYRGLIRFQNQKGFNRITIYSQTLLSAFTWIIYFIGIKTMEIIIQPTLEDNGLGWIMHAARHYIVIWYLAMVLLC